MTESFYEVLGVGENADDEAIRAAYRERLKETHPDVSDDPDADERTRRLVRAKETLLDPVERRRYDRIGHEAYVGGGDDGGSGATRAARDVGGDGDSAEPNATEREATESTGPTNARSGPRERRARERRAREKVDADADWTDDDDEGEGTSGRTTTTDQTTTGWATSMSDRRVDPTVDPTARRRQRTSPLRSLRRSPATVTATFGLYPLLVAGSVLPAFPLYVNVTVAVCTMLLIAALQSMPAVGVSVFAGWSIIGSIALAVAGVHPISLLGLLILGTTWFPLGLSFTTYLVLRA